MRDPFILLDDARAPSDSGELSAAIAPARLYRAPQAVFEARRAEEVLPALCAAEAARARGAHIAGVIAYDAGLALEPRTAPLLGERRGETPLVWLAAFSDYAEIPAEAVPAWLAGAADPAPGPPMLSPMRPAIADAQYRRRFAALREAIAAGDIYQANLTFDLEGRWAGDPVALYAAIRDKAAAGYGGIVYDGRDWVLSFSPELFFALRSGRVTMKPMKGTRPRGGDPAEDRALASALASSGKDRAENLMITDLMRNDVSRLAEPGSVRVEAPFAVETYPTVHQMVTTVRARLPAACGAFELLRALFPCGSITGAPKIRAIELIEAIERRPRGVYCGAIGRIDPGGDAAFNVAIRTLALTGEGGGQARLGVGSAIVADSDPEEEWRECLVKGRFADAGGADFRLIETMRFDPEDGIALFGMHLDRLRSSAAALGFACDHHMLRNAVQARSFALREAAKIRLLLNPDGSHAIEVEPLPEPIGDALGVAMEPMSVDPADWRLRHKTTLRGFYEAAREAAAIRGAGEALLRREDGLLTEGSFTSLFVARKGRLLTPPLRLGLLPGVLRRSLIEQGRAEEAVLTVADLAGGFFMGNALRGLIPARLVGQNE